MRIRHAAVSGRTDDPGNAAPERITREGGRTRVIRRVLHQARAPAGGCRGIRHTVQIGEEERSVFRAEARGLS